MGLLSKLRTAFSAHRLDVRSRFDLLREAVTGTMSKFYMARDRRTGQIVGLKLLDVAKTAAFEARFRGLDKPSEGEIATHLRHPNIVETYEHGVTTDGVSYLIMEFLPGPGLNWLVLSQDPRLKEHGFSYLRQVAEAVAAVHEAGYLHRDVCPRNLMLADDGQTVKLIDFGLSIPATDPFFQPGNRTGNPNYMAPEIVHRRRTNPQVDVFSFGVTAYEFFTCHLPWQMGTTGQVAMTHDRPPTDIRQHRPEIAPHLAKLIHWCIEPEVKKRCPSMQEVVHSLQSGNGKSRNGKP